MMAWQLALAPRQSAGQTPHDHEHTAAFSVTTHTHWLERLPWPFPHPKDPKERRGKMQRLLPKEINPAQRRPLGEAHAAPSSRGFACALSFSDFAKALRPFTVHGRQMQYLFPLGRHGCHWQVEIASGVDQNGLWREEPHARQFYCGRRRWISVVRYSLCAKDAFLLFTY